MNVEGGIVITFVLKYDRKECMNKTIRFPCSMIEEIEAHLQGEDGNVSFSSFVIQACAYVLEDMAKSRENDEAVSDSNPGAKAKDAG